jgi:hypothetical protein
MLGPMLAGFPLHQKPVKSRADDGNFFLQLTDLPLRLQQHRALLDDTLLPGFVFEAVVVRQKSGHAQPPHPIPARVVNRAEWQEDWLPATAGLASSTCLLVGVPFLELNQGVLGLDVPLLGFRRRRAHAMPEESNSVENLLQQIDGWREHGSASIFLVHFCRAQSDESR